MTPIDASVIDTNQGDNSNSDAVLAAIIAKPGDSKPDVEVIKNEAGEVIKKPEVVAKKPEADDEQDKSSDDDGEEDVEETDAEDEEKDEEEKSEKDTSDEDDLDEYLVDVTVDGKVQEVKLKDLKQNFSGNKYIEANVQKAVEARKAAETQANMLFEINKQRKTNLENLDKILKLHAEPNINWEALKESDTNAYLLKREEVRDAQNKQALVQQEVKRIDAEQAEIQAEAMKKYLDGQAEILVTKLPDLRDPKKASKLMDGLEEGAAKYFGYTREEFKGIVDHRALIVLHEAVEARKAKEQKKEVRENINEDTSEKKVLIRPSGQKSSQQAANRKLDQEAIRRARQTGKPDDVAATLLVRKKG